MTNKSKVWKDKSKNSHEIESSSIRFKKKDNFQRNTHIAMAIFNFGLFLMLLVTPRVNPDPTFWYIISLFTLSLCSVNVFWALNRGD